MGKSDKKVKSERINALRKKYDSFLEDDKKRKERNEYILEKLDKMRYCTAMLPVRQKPAVFTDVRKVSLYNMPEKEVDGLANPLDLTRNRIDETVLLQEITKKFILIPKLRSAYEKDYSETIKPKTDSNLDWKSKYDILDQLKRNEKEQDSSEALLKTDQNDLLSPLFKESSDTRNDNQSQYKDELPVKMQAEEQIPENLNYSHQAEIDENYVYDNQLKDAAEIIYQNNTDDTENIMQTATYDPETDNYVNNNQNNNFDRNSDTAYGENSIVNTVQENIDNKFYEEPTQDITEYVAVQEDYLNNEKHPIHENESEKSMQHLDTNKNLTAEVPAEYSPQIDHNIHSQDEFVVTTESVNHEEKIQDENNIVEEADKPMHTNQDEIILTHGSDNAAAVPDGNAMLATNMEYPNETVNIQNYNPHEGMQMVDGVNVNSESEGGNNVVTYDPVEIDNVNTPNETVNAEHNEGYYHEQTGTYDYTTEGVGNYNPEYLTEKAPTENYQQNEEYAYYEGAQPEQPYAEINEHEETTQQYDQTYEQQYGNEAYDQQAYQQQGYDQEYAPGYEQHQEYSEPQQQYEPVDQTQQDLQYENQDNFTAQQVEQQLDNEDNYVANSIKQGGDENLNSPEEVHQVPAVAE